MRDLLQALPPNARVLDLGAAGGSFQNPRSDICVVRVDMEIRPDRTAGDYVAADAARLPFPDRCFDLVVSNHSLEHFVEMEAALRELGRVVRPTGGAFIAVPDAGTLADRIYRWIARGGGHVNAFRSSAQVISLVERLAGLRHRATRELISSLSFLNRSYFRHRPPRRILLFANGNERFLAVLMWTLRWFDAHLHTRLSHYGWAFYFGSADPPSSLETWANVCVRCGCGYPEEYLIETAAIPPAPRRLQWYHCPECGGSNLLSHH